MKSPIPVLLYDAQSSRCAELHARLASRGFAPVAGDAGGRFAPGDAEVAVVLFDHLAGDADLRRMLELIDDLGKANVATIVWGATAHRLPAVGASVDWLAPDASADEIVGRLSALASYRPMLRRLERELDHMQRLGEQLNRYFGEIDQEMRLAGRLQRDFLPRRMPRVGPFAFEALYRPASWVSGDFYDLLRIDDERVGLFVADAMGHGVAAGLLTMFLRQALVARHADASGAGVVAPADAISRLHQSLVNQHLPNCQFVTGVYAIADAARRTLCVARAGHPYPIVMRASGELSELRPAGGLLGLPDIPMEFEQIEVALRPGDKVLFYTDGIEEHLVRPRDEPGGEHEYTNDLLAWSKLPAAGFVEALAGHLDGQEGSLHPADDVTALVLELS